MDEKLILKKRKFRRFSDRTLSASDLRVLDFLWTWKVATRPMLKIAGFPGKSDWWVYKALRRLKAERYIQLLPRGKFVEQELWALTELGFEVVLMDRDDINHYRYRPHAPAHDYLATCLQLGDVWLSQIDRQFFTEQMLASLNSMNFPEKIRPQVGHIPDGVSIITKGIRKITVCYEVDLNLKPEDRYLDALKYLNYDSGANLVIWLVRNQWMAEKIIHLSGRYTFDRSETEQFLKKCGFVLLEDFKQSAWSAKVIIGPLKDYSIRKLHENLLQTPGKEPAKLSQKVMTEIFFPKFRSPQKSQAYRKEVAS